MDKGILIPYTYSRIAHISSLCILHHSVVCYQYDENLLCVLYLLSYIMTNLHWYNLKKNGRIRNFDIAVAHVICIVSIVKAYKYTCFLRFMVGFIFAVTTFRVNEYLNHHSLYQYDLHNMPYKYKYSVYVRSCLVHILSLHIFQMYNGMTMLWYCYEKGS
jgi:hypothetical protein